MLFTEIESRDEHSLAIRGTYYLFRFQKRDGLILSFKKDPPESLPWNQSIPSLFNIGSKHLSVHRIQQAEEIIRTVIGELSGYKKLGSLSDWGIFGMPGVLLSLNIWCKHIIIKFCAWVFNRTAVIKAAESQDSYLLTCMPLFWILTV